MTDARLFGQETRDCRRISCVLLVPEREHTNARSLRHAPEISDWNAGHAVDRGQAVEFERIDYQVKAVGQFRLGLYCYFGHGKALIQSR